MGLALAILVSGVADDDFKITSQRQPEVLTPVILDDFDPRVILHLCSKLILVPFSRVQVQPRAFLFFPPTRDSSNDASVLDLHLYAPPPCTSVWAAHAMQKGCAARALAAKGQRLAAKGRRAANGRRCRCQCSQRPANLVSHSWSVWNSSCCQRPANLLLVRWFEVLHAARGQLTLVSFPNRAVFFSPGAEGVTSFAMVQPAACICFTKSERYHGG